MKVLKRRHRITKKQFYELREIIKDFKSRFETIDCALNKINREIRELDEQIFTIKDTYYFEKALNNLKPEELTELRNIIDIYYDRKVTKF